MLDFFISPAHAQEAAAGGGIAQIVMLVGFVLIFYSLLWRPQAKRAKQHKQLVSGLAKGDEGVIGGGLVGRLGDGGQWLSDRPDGADGVVGRAAYADPVLSGGQG